MRTALMVVVICSAAATIPITVTFFPHPNSTALLGLALVAIAQCVALATLWRGDLRWWTSVLVMSLTSAGLVIAVGQMADLPQLSDTWWPRMLLIATPGYLIASHRRGWVLAAGLIGLNAVVHLRHWQPNPTLPHMTALQEVAAETGQYIAYAAIAWVAVAVLRGTGRAADAAVSAGRQAREDEAAGRLESSQIQEADRFVHDEVLHTLRTIAMAHSAVSATVATRSSRELRALLEMQQEAPPAQDFVDRLRAATDGLGPAVRVEGASGLSLPEDVAAALSAAVSECVRNVERHAGTSEAFVVVRRSGFALSITVRDEGRGFDPGTRTPRLGLRDSVLGRMTDIGGTARIVSAPGRGTTVHLRWSPIPLEENRVPTPLAGGAVAEFFPSMGYLLLPSLLQGVWSAALLASLTRSPLLAVLGTGLCVLSGLWGIRRGMRHGLTAWDSAFLALVTGVCTVIAVTTLPTAGAHPRLLWLVSTATALASLVSLFRPLREAVAMGLGTVIGTSVLLEATHPNAPISPYLSILMSPVIAVGIAIVVRSLINRCAFEIWINEERLRDRQAGLVAGEFFRSRLDQRLLGSRSELINLLDVVISEPAMITSAQIRDRADRLERGLRDVIAVSLAPRLAASLARLRDGGWDIRTRWSGAVPGPVQMHAAAALDLLPADAPLIEGRPSRVTCTGSDHHGTWRLSIVSLPQAHWMTDFRPDARWQVDLSGGLRATLLIRQHALQCSEATL